jgi:hypothetical protein
MPIFFRSSTESDHLMTGMPTRRVISGLCRVNFVHSKQLSLPSQPPPPPTFITYLILVLRYIKCKCFWDFWVLLLFMRFIDRIIAGQIYDLVCREGNIHTLSFLWSVLMSSSHGCSNLSLSIFWLSPFRLFSVSYACYISCLVWWRVDPG